MRIILQRVSDASVTIEYGETRSLRGPGRVALVGFGPGDG
jgi:D-Tyr-tRNAtyr deacylase